MNQTDNNCIRCSTVDMDHFKSNLEQVLIISIYLNIVD